MCDLRGLSKYEINQRNFEFVRNATKEEREEYGWNNNTRGIYKCRKCGKLHYFKKTDFKRYLKICDNECNGTGCRSGRVVYGYNDLKTTHPELVKYFINPEDAKKYTACSGQKVLLKCPKCGKEKWMILSNLSRCFSCDQCSDGISYPEKIITLVLSELNIKFIKQLSYDNGKHKYDFYIKELNAIIEVHGEQHYKNKCFGRGYNEEHKNDLYKYDLAVLNGYEYNKNFFIIDARESNIEYLKYNIDRCKFFKQFDLTGIDWNKIDKNAQTSLKIDVCKYWNENKNDGLSIKDLREIFGVSEGTIRNYLNWGNKNGLCAYDGKEEKIKKCNRQSIFVFLIKENGERWFDAPLSLIELSRRTGITRTTLKRLLYNKKLLTYGNGAKYNLKYIGSMVILAEQTEWKGKTKEETEETKQKQSEAKKDKNNTAAKRVAQYDKQGNLIKIWDCSMDIQRELEIAQGNICNCCKGKRKSAGGFVWRYAEETE